MRLILLFCGLLSLAVARDESPLLGLTKVPELGTVLRNLPSSRVYQIVNSGTTAPSYHSKIDGIEYTIAVSRKERAVLYVGTSSANFKTPEGVSLDSDFAEILQRFPKGKRSEEGWGSYVVLPSGWAAFWTIQGPDDPKLHPIFFFRR